MPALTWPERRAPGPPGPPGPPGRRAAWALALAAALAGGAGRAAPLPAEVAAALEAAGVPAEAMTLVVAEADGGAPLFDWQAEQPMNPASLAKLVTTYAALDQLGPAHVWRMPVWLDGPLRGSVLDGSLVIRASGDPKLVVERVWGLLRRVRQLGVQEIRGDIVLDRSAFAPVAGSPADFDGEPLRPANVLPDALLLSYKTVTYGFTPDPVRGIAAVSVDAPLDGVAVDAAVPLAAGPCDDWRSALGASFADPTHTRFGGSYPAACGERAWPVAYADPAGYNARLLRGLWRELGGRLRGRVRDGAAPVEVAPSFELVSPPLAEVVRDINKFSNNVMAQQLALSLARARQPQRPADMAAARELLREWLRQRLGELPPGVVIDNGSGLSRDTRLPGALLARLLQSAWRSAVMPEFVGSLPVAGLDGTMRRSRATPGRAHLKTGSLRDVAAVAGYLLTDGGRRRVLVAIVNHDRATAARPALDAAVQWAMRDNQGEPASAGPAN